MTVRGHNALTASPARNSSASRASPLMPPLASVWQSAPRTSAAVTGSAPARQDVRIVRAQQLRDAGLRAQEGGAGVDGHHQVERFIGVSRRAARLIAEALLTSTSSRPKRRSVATPPQARRIRRAPRRRRAPAPGRQQPRSRPPCRGWCRAGADQTFRSCRSRRCSRRRGRRAEAIARPMPRFAPVTNGVPRERRHRGFSSARPVSRSGTAAAVEQRRRAR